MQIDFHHAVTYVLARTAGFEHDKAEVLAYGAQYVDDATKAGIILFDNNAMYSRVCSSHKAVDLQNLDNIENLQVWLPFHFLPGNGGLPPGADPEGTFIRKIVCKPNSYVAREMVERCIVEQDRAYGLHRLAVTMHVYADTWAHQGFAGVLNDINKVDDAEDTGKSGAFDKGVGHWLEDLVAHAIPEVGHGQARELPDMPFLQWQYKNGKGELVKRDNAAFFMEAAEEMCKAMQRFLKKDPKAEAPGLDAVTRERIRTRLAGIKNADSAARHKQWLEDLAADAFGFGAVALSYDEDRWKSEALTVQGMRAVKAVAAGAGAGGGTVAAVNAKDLESMRLYKYRPDFLGANWKLFHDAVQAHRLVVLHDILPKYGICSG